MLEHLPRLLASQASGRSKHSPSSPTRPRHTYPRDTSLFVRRKSGIPAPLVQSHLLADCRGPTHAKYQLAPVVTLLCCSGKYDIICCSLQGKPSSSRHTCLGLLAVREGRASCQPVYFITALSAPASVMQNRKCCRHAQQDHRQLLSRRRKGLLLSVITILALTQQSLAGMECRLRHCAHALLEIELSCKISTHPLRFKRSFGGCKCKQRLPAARVICNV